MLTGVDIALLVIVTLSCVVGLWRGFVVEVMSVTVWVAAFWLAFAFGDDIAELFATVVAQPAARLLLGYAMVFVAALLIGGLATWLMGKLVKSTGLSGTDRLLGLGFGLVRGVALSCIAVLLLGFTPLPQQPLWRESRVAESFRPGAEWLRGWLPQAVADQVRFDPLSPIPLPLSPSGGATRDNGDGGTTPPSS